MGHGLRNTYFRQESWEYFDLGDSASSAMHACWRYCEGEPIYDRFHPHLARIRDVVYRMEALFRQAKAGLDAGESGFLGTATPYDNGSLEWVLHLFLIPLGATFDPWGQNKEECKADGRAGVHRVLDEGIWIFRNVWKSLDYLLDLPDDTPLRRELARVVLFYCTKLLDYSRS